MGRRNQNASITLIFLILSLGIYLFFRPRAKSKLKVPVPDVPLSNKYQYVTHNSARNSTQSPYYKYDLCKEYMYEDLLNCCGDPSVPVLGGIDVISYHHKEPVWGFPNITSIIQTKFGKYKFFFATEMAKIIFESDPWTYAPLYGGFSAIGISRFLVGSDLAIVTLGPSSDFRLPFFYDGKLFFISRSDLFSKFDVQTIKKAGRTWSQLFEDNNHPFNTACYHTSPRPLERNIFIWHEFLSKPSRFTAQNFSLENGTGDSLHTSTGNHYPIGIPVANPDITRLDTMAGISGKILQDPQGNSTFPSKPTFHYDREQVKVKQNKTENVPFAMPKSSSKSNKEEGDLQKQIMVGNIPIIRTGAYLQKQIMVDNIPIIGTGIAKGENAGIIDKKILKDIPIARVGTTNGENTGILDKSILTDIPIARVGIATGEKTGILDKTILTDIPIYGGVTDKQTLQKGNDLGTTSIAKTVSSSDETGLEEEAMPAIPPISSAYQKNNKLSN